MADVNLTLTVPSEYTARILAAFNTTSDTDMVLTARGNRDMPDGSDFDGKWHVRIAVKTAEETNAEFAKRYVLDLVKAVIKMSEFATDTTRFKIEVGAVEAASQNVPEDIII